MDTINLALNFVKGQSPTPPDPPPTPDPPVPTPVDPGINPLDITSFAQTGDPLFWAIVALFAIAIIAAGFLVFKKRSAHKSAVSKLMFSNFSTTLKDPEKFAVPKRLLIVIGIAALLFALIGSIFNNTKQDAYANADNNIKQTLTITVYEDGTMTFPDTQILNSLGYDAILTSSKYNIIDASVSSILEGSTLIATGLDGTLFNGGPDQTYTIGGNVRHFKNNTTENIKIGFSLAKAADALSLCDKTPIMLEIYCSKDAGNKLAKLDFGDAKVKDPVKVPKNWILVDNLYVKEFPYQTEYSTIFEDWYSVEFNYIPWANLSGFEPGEGTLDTDTTFTAQWSFEPSEKPLDEYTWDELEYIADDISENYSSTDVSTSIYYEKFAEFASSGEVKNIVLEDDTTLAVRIIGINHDVKGDNKKAGLTFSAVHALSTPYKYDDGSAKNWADSDIRDSMNNPKGEIYNLLPKELTSKIARVSKQYSTGWDTKRESFSLDQSSELEKVWLASATELGWINENEAQDNAAICGEEGFKYEYWNCDPYDYFRKSYLASAGPLLTMLNNDGYTFTTTNENLFAGIWDVYSYCKANKLLVDTSVTLSRSMERVLPESILEGENIAGYFKGLTMKGDFDKTNCPVNLEYAITPCFCIGKDTTDTRTISGKLSYTRETSGHEEIIRPGLKVCFTYNAGREKVVLTGTTDSNGNYKIENVPYGVTGLVSHSNMGYYDESDMLNETQSPIINLNATGPYLDYYSWDDLSLVSDEFTDETIKGTDLENEFKEYATKGTTKEIIVGEGSLDVDYLYVRIIGFNADYKSNQDTKNTAGITFMAVNSLNYVSQYSGLIEDVTSYSNSLIKQSLNDGGDIYSRMPQELKNNIVPVIKQSTVGWNLIEYSPEITYSLEKMFVPSLSELGDSTAEKLGETYEYIGNNPYQNFKWAQGAKTPLMACANAYGYKWILENGEDYNTANELYNDAQLQGIFPSYIIPYLVYANGSFTRDVSPVSSMNVGSFTYEGDYVHDTDKFLSATTIAPCFSVGSYGHISTTRRISGKVNVPTSIFEGNKDLTGMNVILDFVDSEYNDSMMAKTNSAGEFVFEKVPIYSLVSLTASGKGYSGVTDVIYVEDNIDNLNINTTGPTLNGYTWDELKEIALKFSDGSVSEGERDAFYTMAQRGDLKKVYLNNPADEKDCLYFRIADFCHDDLANPTDEYKKAGITFVAVNSINQLYYFNEITDASTKSAINWDGSTVRQSLNYGEIYSLLPDEIKVVTAQVKKPCVTGWQLSGLGLTFNDTIITTTDKFFLPSYAELGLENDYYKAKEGTKYKYINNDPYAKYLTGVTPEPITPCLAGLNYIGLEYLLRQSSLDQYTSMLDVYRDCNAKGGAIWDFFSPEGDGFYYTASRSMPYQALGEASMIYALCHGIYSNIDPQGSSDISEGYAMDIYGTPVAPCFCL